MLQSTASAKKQPRCHIILVTAPNLKVARHLAGLALQEKLAACANLIPKLESHYWWQGKIERAPEVLILFKTSRPQVGRLEKLILMHHPYDTPEFLVLPISAGNRAYLKWLQASVA